MPNSEKMKSSSASANLPKPNLEKFKQETYLHRLYDDITRRTIRKLNRLIGQYSMQNEGKLANEIISLIENEIKKGTENAIISDMDEKELDSGSVTYRDIYLSTKNILLEFGLLMAEGKSEKIAKKDDRQGDVANDRKNEESMLVILREEINNLEALLKSADSSHLINAGVHEELSVYIRILRKDIDRFEAAHKLDSGSKMKPDASTASSR